MGVHPSFISSSYTMIANISPRSCDFVRDSGSVGVSDSETSHPAYISQPNDWSCGPTAIYNLLKWSRSPATPQTSFRKLCQSCHCQTRAQYGSMYRVFCQTIDKVVADDATGLNLVGSKIYPTFREIQNHLRTGSGAVILNFHWSTASPQERWSDPLREACEWRERKARGEAGEHYVFMDECTPSGVWVINYGPDKPTRALIPNREVKEMLWHFTYPEDVKYGDSPLRQPPFDQMFPKAWFFTLRYSSRHSSRHSSRNSSRA